jgi:hypothetical protein
MNMRKKIRAVVFGTALLGVSMLPLSDMLPKTHLKKPVQTVQRKDLSKMLQGPRENKLAAAWDIASVPWKKGVKEQIDRAINPLLRNLQDDDIEVRIVSSMALRTIAEKGKEELVKHMPLIRAAFEKESKPDVRSELAWLITQIDRSYSK